MKKFRQPLDEYSSPHSSYPTNQDFDPENTFGLNEPDEKCISDLQDALKKCNIRYNVESTEQENHVFIRLTIVKAFSSFSDEQLAAVRTCLREFDQESFDLIPDDEFKSGNEQLLGHILRIIPYELLMKESGTVERRDFRKAARDALMSKLLLRPGLLVAAEWMSFLIFSQTWNATHSDDSDVPWSGFDPYTARASVSVTRSPTTDEFLKSKTDLKEWTDFLNKQKEEFGDVFVVGRHMLRDMYISEDCLKLTYNTDAQNAVGVFQSEVNPDEGLIPPLPLRMNALSRWTGLDPATFDPLSAHQNHMTYQFGGLYLASLLDHNPYRYDGLNITDLSTPSDIKNRGPVNFRSQAERLWQMLKIQGAGEGPGWRQKWEEEYKDYCLQLFLQLRTVNVANDRGLESAKVRNLLIHLYYALPGLRDAVFHLTQNRGQVSSDPNQSVSNLDNLAKFVEEARKKYKKDAQDTYKWAGLSLKNSSQSSKGRGDSGRTASMSMDKSLQSTQGRGRGRGTVGGRGRGRGRPTTAQPGQVGLPAQDPVYDLYSIQETEYAGATARSWELLRNLCLPVVDFLHHYEQNQGHHVPAMDLTRQHSSLLSTSLPAMPVSNNSRINFLPLIEEKVGASESPVYIQFDSDLPHRRTSKINNEIGAFSLSLPAGALFESTLQRDVNDRTVIYNLTQREPHSTNFNDTKALYSFSDAVSQLKTKKIRCQVQDPAITFVLDFSKNPPSLEMTNEEATTLDEKYFLVLAPSQTDFLLAEDKDSSDDNSSKTKNIKSARLLITMFYYTGPDNASQTKLQQYKQRIKDLTTPATINSILQAKKDQPSDLESWTTILVGEAQKEKQEPAVAQKLLMDFNVFQPFFPNKNDELWIRRTEMLLSKESVQWARPIFDTAFESSAPLFVATQIEIKDFMNTLQHSKAEVYWKPAVFVCKVSPANVESKLQQLQRLVATNCFMIVLLEFFGPHEPYRVFRFLDRLLTTARRLRIVVLNTNPLIDQLQTTPLKNHLVFTLDCKPSVPNLDGFDDQSPVRQVMQAISDFKPTDQDFQECAQQGRAKFERAMSFLKGDFRSIYCTVAHSSIYHVIKNQADLDKVADCATLDVHETLAKHLKEPAGCRIAIENAHLLDARTIAEICSRMAHQGHRIVFLSTQQPDFDLASQFGLESCFDFRFQTHLHQSNLKQLPLTFGSAFKAELEREDKANNEDLKDLVQLLSTDFPSQPLSTKGLKENSMQSIVQVLKHYADSLKDQEDEIFYSYDFFRNSECFSFVPEPILIARWIKYLSQAAGVGMDDEILTELESQMRFVAADGKPFHLALMELKRADTTNGSSSSKLFTRNLQDQSLTNAIQLLRQDQQINWNAAYEFFDRTPMNLKDFMNLIQICTQPFRILVSFQAQKLDQLLQGASERQLADLATLFRVDSPKSGQMRSDFQQLKELLQNFVQHTDDNNFENVPAWMLSFSMLTCHLLRVDDSLLIEEALILLTRRDVDFHFGENKHVKMLSDFCKSDQPIKLFERKQAWKDILERDLSPDEVSQLLPSDKQFGATLADFICRAKSKRHHNISIFAHPFIQNCFNALHGDEIQTAFDDLRSVTSRFILRFLEEATVDNIGSITQLAYHCVSDQSDQNGVIKRISNLLNETYLNSEQNSFKLAPDHMFHFWKQLSQLLESNEWPDIMNTVKTTTKPNHSEAERSIQLLWLAATGQKLDDFTSSLMNTGADDALKITYGVPLHKDELRPVRQAIIDFLISSDTALIDLKFLRDLSNRNIQSILHEVLSLFESSGDSRRAEIALFLWCLSPLNPLPFVVDSDSRFTLNKDFMSKLFSFVKELGPSMQRRVQSSLWGSLEAIWLTKPHLLSVARLRFLNQHFKDVLPDPSYELKSIEFCVGQNTDEFERVLTASAYDQRSNGVELFMTAVHALVNSDFEASPDYTSIQVDLDSGCSLSTMALNVSALIDVGMQLSQKPSGDNEVNLLYLRDRVITWLSLLGVTTELLKSEIYVKLNEFGKTCIDPNSIEDKTYLEKPCKLPMLNFFDVHIVNPTAFLYFGETDQDKAMTRQLVALLAPSLVTDQINLIKGAALGEIFGKRVLNELGKVEVTGFDDTSMTKAKDMCSFFINVMSEFFSQEAAHRAHEIADHAVRSFLQVFASTDYKLTQAWISRWIIRSMSFGCGQQSPPLLGLVLPTMKEMKMSVCKSTIQDVVKPDMDIQVDDFHGFLVHLQSPRGLPSMCTAISKENDSENELSNSCGKMAIKFSVETIPKSEASQVIQHFVVPSTIKPTESIFVSNDFKKSSVVTSSIKHNYQPKIQTTEGIAPLEMNDIPPIIRVYSLLEAGPVDLRHDENLRIAPAQGAKDACMQGLRIHVKPGPGGVVVRSKNYSAEGKAFEVDSTLMFVDRRDISKLDDTYERLVTLPSHEHAWNFLIDRTPAGTILIGHGIILKKSDKTRQFHPIFIDSVDRPFEYRDPADSLFLLSTLEGLGMIQSLREAAESILALGCLKVIATRDQACLEQLKTLVPATNETKCQVQQRWIVTKYRELYPITDDELKSMQQFAREVASPTVKTFQSNLSNSQILSVLFDVSSIKQDERQLDEESWVAHLQEALEKSSHCQEILLKLIEREPPYKNFLNPSYVFGVQTLHQDMKPDVFGSPLPFSLPDFTSSGTTPARYPFPDDVLSKSNLFISASEMMVDVSNNSRFLFTCPLGIWNSSDSHQRLMPLMQTRGSDHEDSLDERNQVTVLCPPCRRQSSFLMNTHDTYSEDGFDFGLIVSHPNYDLQLQSECSWIEKVVMSPLSPTFKAELIDMAFNPDSLRLPPFLEKYTNVDVDSHLIPFLTAHSLADVFPHPDTAAVLRAAFKVDEDVLKFIQHKANVYGVYVCSPYAKQLLRQYLIPILEIDCQSFFARGQLDEDQLYLSLIKEFRRDKLVLYLRNLGTAKDHMLKWCCEHTKAAPYHYFYFEDIDTSHNLAENRDRCNFDFYDRRTLEELEYGTSSSKSIFIESKQFTKPSEPFTDTSDLPAFITEVKNINYDLNLHSKEIMYFMKNRSVNPITSYTEMKGAWKQSLREFCGLGGPLDYSRDKKTIEMRIVHTAPGAGKTVLTEKHVQPAIDRMEDTNYVYFDASDARLVRESLSSLIQQSFPSNSKVVFLVVDEFHMLSAEQKFELLQILNHLKKSIHRLEHLRVLAFANRIESQDYSLTQSFSDEGIDNLDIKLLSGRLCMSHIRAFLQMTVQEQGIDVEKAQHFVSRLTWWFGACRALFSDLVLTLRIVPLALKAIQSDDPGYELGDILVSKLPSVREFTARKISTCILELCAEEERLLSTNDLDDLKQRIRDFANRTDEDPMKIIARTAVLSFLYTQYRCFDVFNPDFSEPEEVLEGLHDSSEPDEHVLKSYPAMSQNIENSFQLHPSIRLTAWICFIYENVGSIFSEDGLKFTLPKVSLMRNLNVIDQPDFPLITATTSKICPLDVGRGFSEPGDYSDLTWMVNCLHRNIAISWSKAQEQWRTTFIADLDQYLRLVQACPDPGTCLTALHPDNLCNLIVTSRADLSFCKTVIQQLVSSAYVNELNKPNNPYYLALWMLYKQREITESYSSTKLLLWASSFAKEYPLNAVEEMNRTLVSDLENATTCILEQSSEASVVADLSKLWCSTFAPLFPSEPQSDHMKLTGMLLARQYSPNPIPCLNMLSRLFHETYSTADLVHLARSSYFRDPSDGVNDAAMRSRTASFSNTSICIPESNEFNLRQDLISSLLADQQETLPALWQRILCTQLKPSDVSEDAFSVLEKQQKNMLYINQKFGCLRDIATVDEILPLIDCDSPLVSQSIKNVLQSIRNDLQSRFRALHGGDRRIPDDNPIDVIGNRRKKELNQRTRKLALLAEEVFNIPYPQPDHSKDKTENKAIETTIKKHASIFKYFNETLSHKDLLRQQREQVNQFEYDEYKNPTGADFDLARTGAFSGFRILVGQFYRSPSKGYYVCTLNQPIDKDVLLSALSSVGIDFTRWILHHQDLYCHSNKKDLIARLALCRDSLKRNNINFTVDDSKVGHHIPLSDCPNELLESNLNSIANEKGWIIEYVYDEFEFARKLNNGRPDETNRLKYHVVVITSGSARSMMKASNQSPQQARDRIRAVAESCYRFHLGHGGLFIQAENDPQFVHANAVLACINGQHPDSCNWLYDNVKGRNFMPIEGWSREDTTSEYPRSNGVIKDHLITAGIVNLFEGITVCTFNPEHQSEHVSKWTTIATGGYLEDTTTDPVPIINILDIAGRGRVAVDTGFTKNWFKWKVGAVDRYFSNTVAWLCGIERKLSQVSSLDPPSLLKVLQRVPEIRSDFVAGHLQSVFSELSDVNKTVLNIEYLVCLSNLDEMKAGHIRNALQEYTKDIKSLYPNAFFSLTVFTDKATTSNFATEINFDVIVPKSGRPKLRKGFESLQGVITQDQAKHFVVFISADEDFTDIQDKDFDQIKKDTNVSFYSFWIINDQDPDAPGNFGDSTDKRFQAALGDRVRGIRRLSSENLQVNLMRSLQYVVESGSEAQEEVQETLV